MEKRSVGDRPEGPDRNAVRRWMNKGPTYNSIGGIGLRPLVLRAILHAVAVVFFLLLFLYAVVKWTKGVAAIFMLSLGGSVAANILALVYGPSGPFFAPVGFLISFGVLYYAFSEAKTQNRRRGVWLTLSATFGIFALIVLVYRRPVPIHEEKDPI